MNARGAASVRMRLGLALLCCALAERACGLASLQPPRLSRRARRAAAPLLREVNVADLPLRPPMAPATLVEHEPEAAAAAAAVGPAVIEEGDDDEEEAGFEEASVVVLDETEDERRARVKAEMDAAVIGDANSKVVMERLKGQEDDDGGLAALLGSFLVFLDPTGTVRRRLWTRADFMHIHAVSGAYFLFLGIPWLVYSHVTNALDTSVPMATSGPFLTSLLVAGLVNALSAVPMSKFNSNKMLDMRDLKANGFTFGGTGLTTMCLYIAWWFSGDYPGFLRPFDIPIFLRPPPDADRTPPRPNPSAVSALRCTARGSSRRARPPLHSHGPPVPPRSPPLPGAGPPCVRAVKSVSSHL